MQTKIVIRYMFKIGLRRTQSERLDQSPWVCSKLRSFAARIFIVIFVVIVCSPFQVALAKDGTWSSATNGIIHFGLENNSLEKNNLVPDPQQSGFKQSTKVQTSRVDFKAWKGLLEFNAQLRLALSSEKDSKAEVDQWYAEYSLTDELFLYLGRRNVVFGQSYGTNPLDVFFDPLALDRTLNEDRRRREVNGQDMLGFEALRSDTFSVIGYWAPSYSRLNQGRPDRALIAVTSLFLKWNADITLLAFEDSRPGVGLSFTKSVDDAILLYGDVSLRRGRDRFVISRDQGSAISPGDFLMQTSDHKQQYVETSLGFSYTFESGATINTEYYYNQNGYTDSEWGKISQIININAGNLAQGRYSGLPESNLLSLNSALRHSVVRRHYGFVRGYHPDPFDFGMSTEATVFHNLQDQSGVASLRLEYGVKSSVLLGVYISTNCGSGMDEFRLHSNKLSSALYVTVYL